MKNHRKLPFSGVTNLRDLGGYTTIDGRSVKWRKLFRSDNLANLSIKGQSYFQKIGLKLIIDLRSSMERKKKPNPVMKGIIDFHNPIFDEFGLLNGNILEMVINFAMNKDAHATITNFYKKMVTLPFAQNSYRKLFDLIIQMDDPVVLLHCTAGKDRTGFISAIILLILGVTEKTIMQDYLLTNTYRASFNDMVTKKINQHSHDVSLVNGLMSFLKADESYLQAAFDEIKNKYHSTDIYITEILGLSVDKRLLLQEKFLI
jgi:protein-tyrosine phosphatase